MNTWSMKPKHNMTLVYLRVSGLQFMSGGGWTRLHCPTESVALPTLMWLRSLYRLAVVPTVQTTVRSTTSALQAASENERTPKKTNQTHHHCYQTSAIVDIIVIKHHCYHCYQTSFINRRHHCYQTSLLSDIAKISRPFFTVRLSFHRVADVASASLHFKLSG